MAGKIIADIIEAPYDAIRMNVANVTVLTANSSGLTYIPTGNVNVTIGGANANLTMNILTANGIKFPASQVSSADANTLDDYEEGTFTPTIVGTTTAGSASYSYQTGTYRKIGSLVYVQITLNWSGHTGTGSVRISGLPFTSVSGGTYGWGQLTGMVNSLALTASNYFQSAEVNGGATTATLYQGPVGGGGWALISMDATADIELTGCYITS